MTKTYTHTIIVIFLAVSALLAYSFTGAWTAPPANPPQGNTTAPINVGPDAQVKAGSMGMNILLASRSVWSDRYCNSNGANCFTPAQAVTGVSCVAMPLGKGGRELTNAEAPDGNRYMIMPESVSRRCMQLGHDFGYATNLFPPMTGGTQGWCGFNNARTANWVSDGNGSRWQSTGCTNWSVGEAVCCSI